MMGIEWLRPAAFLGSMLYAIIGVLIFSTLYEQTYGSWVTFTDRLLTKDMFPGLGGSGENVTLPWSMFLLGVSPLLMIVALKASDAGRAGVAKLMAVLLALGLGATSSQSGTVPIAYSRSQWAAS